MKILPNSMQYPWNVSPQALFWLCLWY